MYKMWYNYGRVSIGFRTRLSQHMSLYYKI